MKTIARTCTIIMLIAVSSLNVNASSTGEILGQVKDQETKKPVAYAEITFESAMDKVVVVANENGFYYGNHIPTGKYDLTIKYNNRTFVMKRVRVFDGYASEVNFMVSSNAALPTLVEVKNDELKISAINPTDIKLSGDKKLQATRSLGDVLSTQPGLDVRNGQLYIKGSNEVRFFIDGTPVMGRPVMGGGF